MIDEEKDIDEKVEELLKRDIDNAWSALLETQSGRLILWSILDKCGLNNFAFNGNAHDALQKGRQQIASEILNEYVYPKGMQVYADMLLEAEARDKRLVDAATVVEQESEEIEDE